MTCPNCGKETKGIKLNGKLFCNFCGEIIKDSTDILEEKYKHNPMGVKSKASEMKPATPEVIQQTEIETDMLEAEKEVLELITNRQHIGKPKILKDMSIKKHQRPRVGHNNYDLIPGEPDPVSNPEIESPHDSLLEDDRGQTDPKTPTTDALPKDDSKNAYNFMPKADRDTLKAKEKQKQDVFTSFLKETTRAISDKNPPKKKKKSLEHSHKHKILWTFIAIIFVTLIAIAGLVYYVNVVANNETKIQKGLEDNINFNYHKPTEAPAGYKLSYLSQSDSNYVFYYYVYTGDDNRFISLKVEQTSLKTGDILNSFIKNKTVSYSMLKKNDLEFWKTSSNNIYVIDNSILYTFSGSTGVNIDLLSSYAEGVLL
jgi:uncharacterized Zn finger protein (UPF0148 family)